MNWAALIVAVAQIESGGDHSAFNAKEGAVGELQVRQCVLDDVNRFYHMKIAMADVRKHRTVARLVFTLYVRMYGAETYEQAARIWNGGPRGMKKQTTLGYWLRVKNQLKGAA